MSGTNSFIVVSTNDNVKATDEAYYRTMAQRKVCKLKILQNMKMSIEETGNVIINFTEIDQLIDMSEIWSKATIAKEIADNMPSNILRLCPCILCNNFLKEYKLNYINHEKYKYLRANKDFFIQQLRNEVNTHSSQQLQEHISLLTKAINQTDFNELVAAAIATDAAESMQAMQGMQAMQAMMMR